MRKWLTRISTWWKRNEDIKHSLESVGVMLFSLGGIAVLAWSTERGSADYSYTQKGVFLVCTACVMMVLLLKPPSMWRGVRDGLGDLIARHEVNGDRALALLLMAMLALVAAVAWFLLDITALNRVLGIGGVAAVNLSIGLRGLWIKYGSQKRRRPL